MVTAHSDCCHACSRPWDGTRSVPEDARTGEAKNSPPLTVARALREHCNIPFESFFLATHLGQGNFAYFSGPGPIAEENIRKMFMRDKYLKFQERASLRDGVQDGYEDDYGCYSTRTSAPDDRWPAEPSRRKRPRRQAPMRRELDDDAPPVITSSRKTLVIGDSEAVMEFYDRGFKAIQQTACKEIAKAFIKIFCPKKQARHPYVEGDKSAPDWWPLRYGPGEKDKVRHVEPDHMWKIERVYILKYMLRMIIQPEIRSPSVQKLGVLAMDRFEAVAMDSLSSWFVDPKKPKNARKKPILKEIFRVAKMEERYRKNEIDATTQILVTADDMVMNHCFDPEEEMADDLAESAAMEAERCRLDPLMARITPTRTTTVPMLPSMSSTSPSVQTLTNQFQTTPFLHELPIRAHGYSAPAMLPAELTADQYPYADGHTLAATHPAATMQMHALMTGSPHHHQGPHTPQHDTSRRSSLFVPTTEFASPSPSAIYHHPSPWPQSPQAQGPATPSSTGAPSPGSSPLFAYAHTHGLPSHHHHQPPSQQQQQQHHHHHGHVQQQQQQQQQQQATGVPALPRPMPMVQMAHQQHQQHPHTSAYSTSAYYTTAVPHGLEPLAEMSLPSQHQHQHQHQHHQQQQQHHHTHSLPTMYHHPQHHQHHVQQQQHQHQHQQHQQQQLMSQAQDQAQQAQTQTQRALEAAADMGAARA